jgi:hypothetical protein
LYQPIGIYLLWLMLFFFWLGNQREERKSFDARMRQLQQELAAAKESAAAVEAGMVAALASKNAEIDSLSSSVESFKRQASMAEGKLAALQVGLWCPSPKLHPACHIISRVLLSPFLRLFSVASLGSI